MSKRNLFEELSTALVEAKQHSEGKLTLRTHVMSRGVFARHLHTSARTLESWEQGRTTPNGQAVTLLRLVQRHPETLSYIAEL